MLKKVTDTFVGFVQDEEGLALTEYLILLGLLTAGVITAVIAVGGSLETAWENWANWFATNIETNQPGNIAT
jgi:pilus assembly protein Flp/PilA